MILLSELSASAIASTHTNGSCQPKIADVDATCTKHGKRLDVSRLIIRLFVLVVSIMRLDVAIRIPLRTLPNFGQQIDLSYVCLLDCRLLYVFRDYASLLPK